MHISSALLAAAALALTAVACTRTDHVASVPPAIRESAELDSILDALRARYQLPALAAAVVRGDSAIIAGVVGMRRLDGPDGAQLEDRFHLGSVTKPITATLIATLVADGQLRWSTTPLEVFPELAATSDTAFRHVTLEQLLDHHAGLEPFEEDSEIAAVPAGEGSEAARRYAAVRWLLTRPLVAAPGTRYLYSNAGYGLATAMAERVTHRSWEALLEERVYRPLGIRSADVGWPARGGRAAPWGHWERDGRIVPHDPSDAYHLAPLIMPAGDIAISITDLARFARLHLDGLRARPTAILDDSTFRLIHASRDGYGLGWNIRPKDARPGTGTSSHAGSVDTFNAGVVVAPTRDCAVVFATNTGVVAEGFARALAVALFDRCAPARFAPTS